MEKRFKRSGGMCNKVTRPYSHRHLLRGDTRPSHQGCPTAVGSAEQKRKIPFKPIVLYQSVNFTPPGAAFEENLIIFQSFKTTFR